MSGELPGDAISAAVRAVRGCNISRTSIDTPEIVARAVLEAVAPVIAAQAATTERERWLAILAEHYLMNVICDPDTHQDNAVCGCSRVFLGWHPSIGEARDAWIRHVRHVAEFTDDAQ